MKMKKNKKNLTEKSCENDGSQGNPGSVRLGEKKMGKRKAKHSLETYLIMKKNNNKLYVNKTNIPGSFWR